MGVAWLQYQLDCVCVVSVMLTVCVSVCLSVAACYDKSRRDWEVGVARLQQQLSAVTQRSRDSEHELKLCLQREKLARDADVGRLGADKVRASYSLSSTLRVAVILAVDSSEHLH